MSTQKICKICGKKVTDEEEFYHEINKEGNHDRCVERQQHKEEIELSKLTGEFNDDMREQVEEEHFKEKIARKAFIDEFNVWFEVA